MQGREGRRRAPAPLVGAGGGGRSRLDNATPSRGPMSVSCGRHRSRGLRPAWRDPPEPPPQGRRSCALLPVQARTGGSNRLQVALAHSMITSVPLRRRGNGSHAAWRCDAPFPLDKLPPPGFGGPRRSGQAFPLWRPWFQPRRLPGKAAKVNIILTQNPSVARG
jgi:hypothetical protein